MTTKEYYQIHREAILKAGTDYYWKHKIEINKAQREYREQIRMRVFIHYGGNPPKCACCGETIVGFLTIDHPNNDGAKEHKKKLPKTRGSGFWFYSWLIKMNYPKGYQVQCYNCNCGRAHTLNKTCPHKETMANVV